MGEPFGDCATRREAGRVIYGGGGSSSSSTKLPAELRPLASAYAKKAQQIGNTPFQAYTGQRFANLTGDQNAAIGMIRDRAMNGSPVMDQADQTLMQTLQGGQTNPYLNSMVDQAQQSVARTYNLLTKPQTESAMVRSGSFGNSGLQQMQQEQQRQATEQMGNIATQMYGQAYDQDRARQMQALGMAPTYANQAYADAGQLLGAGGLLQQQQQQGLDFKYDQFLERQNQPYKNLAAMGAPFGANMGSTTTTSQGSGSRLAGAAGGAMMGAQIGSVVPGIGTAIGAIGGGIIGALSDKRAKTDIKRVGKTDDGLPVYTYRYKAGGPVQMGVMAQDVQKKTPDAVFDAGGLLAVDYTKVS